jgi:hypothetical protein
VKTLTLQSKLWWLVKPDEIRPKKGIVLVDAVKRVVETFKFAAAPTSLPGPNDGFTFREGGISTANGPVAIEELSIFPDGISVQVYSSTEDLQLALDQILSLMQKLGFSEPITPPKYVLQSMITFEAEADLNKLASAFDPITKAIGEVTGAEAPHELKVIEYTVDPKVVPPLGSKVFRLERRTNEPFSLNRWFSFANATTDDHIKILEMVEGIAATKGANN